MSRKSLKLTSPSLKYYHYAELRAMYFGGNRSSKMLRQDWDEEDRDEETEYNHKRELEMQRVFDCATRFLTDNEFQCFYLFFFSDTCQEEIAGLMEVSQPMVNKYLVKSMNKIRRNVYREMNQLTFDINL